MALITVDEFRDRFDIDNEIDNKRIEPHIGSASRRLRGWVGSTNYDAAVAASTNGADADTDLVNDLKNAEAHLTYHFAIYGLNSPLSGKGVVATAMAAEGREVRKYLTPKETAELAGYFLELAREICSPYLSAVDESGIQLLIASCNDAEGATRTC